MRLLFALFILLVICSCASISIDARRDPNYDKSIRKVFIVIHASESASGFVSKLKDQLSLRLTLSKVVHEIYTKEALTLTNDDGEIDERIKKLEPDAVISINQTEGTVSSLGRLLYSGVFDVKVFDYPTQKVVWRAMVSANNDQILPLNNPTVVSNFLDKLLTKLHQDKML